MLDEAPLVWISGDVHLENFGSYKGDNGLVYFDLNDFDEACLAPALVEMVRLLSSVIVAADTLNVKHADALALCRASVDAYADALAAGKARWIEAELAEGMVRDLFDGLAGRKRVELLDRRTERVGTKRRLKVDGKKALPADDAARGCRRRARRALGIQRDGRVHIGNCGKCVTRHDRNAAPEGRRGRIPAGLAGAQSGHALFGPHRLPDPHAGGAVGRG